MPTSGDLPQPMQKEVAQTPRQRVGGSISERGHMAISLNRLLNPETTEEYEDWAQSHPEDVAKTEELKKRLIEKNVEFLEKIVSNLPEAEAWEGIAREDWEMVSDNAKLKAAGQGFVDSYSREIALRECSKEYAAAKLNLQGVQRKNGPQSGAII